MVEDPKTSSSDLVRIFQETQDIINQNMRLKRLTEESRNNTVLYDENFISSNRSAVIDVPSVAIVQKPSFECARNYIDSYGKVAVLNFANPYKPGGGVLHGARAQEESLCRCSNLYNCISKPEMLEQYYHFHKMMNNDLFSDRIIYSPAVTVFRNDITYNLLHNMFCVDVITCAAPYNVYGHDAGILTKVYEKRIKNILEVSMHNDVRILILGAFGCGAFHNPPELMAQAFKKCIVEDGYYQYFDKVCFSIYTTSIFDKNLDAFKAIFAS